jgi:hypothetical protein
MTNKIVNPSPYLRTTRSFPQDPQALQVEVNKAYLDTANVINERVIGLFPLNRPAITGEKYFFTSRFQQALRQIFYFTSTTSFNHNIPSIPFPNIVHAYGTYTDSTGTSTYGLVYGTSVAVAGQVGFYISQTQIVFTVGAGAPTLAKGYIVVEWLSNP